MTLRRLRERAKFPTAKSLAAKAKLKESTVLKIEGGKVADPRYTTVEALAAAMETSMAAVKRAIDQTVREATAKKAAA